MPLLPPRRRPRRAPSDALFAGAVFVAMLAAGRPKPAARLGLSADDAGRRTAAGMPAAAARGARADGRPAPVASVRASLVAGAADRPAPATDPQLDAFARDLVASGQAPPGRAWALAELAVRHARAHDLPPALVLGVLLVENDALNSRARSSAGALGLMQVHPLWRPLLGPRYGFDLTADSTNLGMGAHILAEGLAAARSAADVDRGLLRYNGCRRALVRARDASADPTPAPCAKYPLRVRRRVEQQAALCPTRSFTRCVVRPLRLASVRAAARASE